MDWRGIFNAIWVLDFEFSAPDGGLPSVVCMVARELKSGKEMRLWRDDLGSFPFNGGPDELFVAYYASAEIGCFLSLGWPTPVRILDLYAEFRALTNGHADVKGASLLAAAEAFGLSGMASDEKASMRDLILSGGPWTPKERTDILDYCAADVDLTAALFNVMWPRIATDRVALGQALFRGRYMSAVAHMEAVGVPLDWPLLERLRYHWPHLKRLLIDKVDRAYGVYEAGHFVRERFEALIRERGYAWPVTERGQPRLDDDTFADMALRHPELSSLRELRGILSRMKQIAITVGPDGRNRTLLSPFRSKTGRNQPSNAKFIFGPSTWLRGLIRPEAGFGVAYCDFSSQEIAIAAALSGDAPMWQAYASGDPYMAFAIQAGMAPPDATKATHKAIRDRCKQIVLGVGYGMGASSMAVAAGIHLVEAEELLTRHRNTYRKFWAWAEQLQNAAMMGERLMTPLGWPLQIRGGADINPRSLLNWPMQAGGSDMMRLACCMLTEAGVEVCCPVHDAVLIRFPIDDRDRVVALTQTLMGDASEIVMGSGRRCRVDVDITIHPERFMDPRGSEMWSMIMSLLADLESGELRPVST